MIKRTIWLAIAFILYFGTAGLIEAGTTTGHIVRTPEVDKMMREDWKKSHFDGCYTVPDRNLCFNIKAQLLTFKY